MWRLWVFFQWVFTTCNRLSQSLLMQEGNWKGPLSFIRFFWSSILCDLSLFSGWSRSFLCWICGWNIQFCGLELVWRLLPLSVLVLQCFNYLKALAGVCTSIAQLPLRFRSRCAWHNQRSIIFLGLVHIDSHELFLIVLIRAYLSSICCETLRRADILARALFNFILSLITSCQIVIRRLMSAIQRCRQWTVVLDRDRIKVILGHLARVWSTSTPNFLGAWSATVDRRRGQTYPTLNLLMVDWRVALGICWILLSLLLLIIHFKSPLAKTWQSLDPIMILATTWLIIVTIIIILLLWYEPCSKILWLRISHSGTFDCFIMSCEWVNLGSCGWHLLVGTIVSSDCLSLLWKRVLKVGVFSAVLLLLRVERGDRGWLKLALTKPPIWIAMLITICSIFGQVGDRCCGRILLIHLASSLEQLLAERG